MKIILFGENIMEIILFGKNIMKIISFSKDIISSYLFGELKVNPREYVFSQDPLKLHIARHAGERFRPSIKTLIILEVGERGSSWSTGRQKGNYYGRRRKRITRKD